MRRSAAALLLAACGLAAPAFAGGIRTELDRREVKLEQPFTLRFYLPTVCSWGTVDLPASTHYKVVSRDSRQVHKLGRVRIEGGGRVRQESPLSESHVSYVLKPMKAGTLVFEPIQVRCGNWVGETFRAEIRVLPGPGNRMSVEPEAPRAARSSPADESDEHLLGKTVALQQMAGRTGPLQPADGPEQDALSKAPMPFASPSSPQAPKDVSPGARAWALLKAAWNFKLSHLAVLGLFTALALAYLLIERAGGLKEYLKKRRKISLAPEIAVRTKTAGAARAISGDDVENVVIGGKYELEKKIGSGGMGVVYLAKDLKLGRKVAVKKMREEFKYSSSERQSFLREAMIVARMVHPYIVSLHEIVEQDGDVYLIMEHMDGQPLSRIIDDAKRLGLKECQEVFNFVCQAVDFAHRNDVLHLDLKPANIMIERGGFAKVMDFGLAYESKSVIARTTKKEAAGTLAYMAPEQHTGSPTAASDLFALGVCLYESLTGGLPFGGPDYLSQKERMTYRLPTEVVAGLPKEIDALAAALLQPDPKHRMSSALELLQALRKI